MSKTRRTYSDDFDEENRVEKNTERRSKRINPRNYEDFVEVEPLDTEELTAETGLYDASIEKVNNPKKKEKND